jgi:hypothetical protein
MTTEDRDAIAALGKDNDRTTEWRARWGMARTALDQLRKLNVRFEWPKAALEMNMGNYEESATYPRHYVFPILLDGEQVAVYHDGNIFSSENDPGIYKEVVHGD